MDDRILDFARLLREAGLAVSTSEVLDAVSALEVTGVHSFHTTRDTLRCTLVKREGDVAPFETLFDFFFFGRRRALEAMRVKTEDAAANLPENVRRLLQRFQEGRDGLDAPLSELARAMLTGDMTRVEYLLLRADAWHERTVDRGAGGGVLRYVEFLTRRLELATIENQLDALSQAVGEEPEERRALSQYLKQLLVQLRRVLHRHAENILRGSRGGAGRRELPGYVFEKSFVHYTEEDILRMNDAVRRLAQHFKNVLALRRKRTPKGRLDLKRTLRRNLQYSGVPFEICWDRRRKAKPQVFVLCDISDSVLNASRFMLQFVHSIQELYSRVRSFVFVADLAEVTELFEKTEVQQAVEMALKGDLVDVYEHSNFGAAFRIFHERYLSAIDRRTTVIIMGDGRNNYNKANAWVLKDIHQRAKELVWLNPEQRGNWGLGDSEMPRYMEYCQRVEECRNMRQLYRIVGRFAS